MGQHHVAPPLARARAELVAARTRVGRVHDVAAALGEAAAAPELVDDHGDLAVLDHEIADAARGEEAGEPSPGNTSEGVFLLRLTKGLLSLNDGVCGVA